MPADFTKALNLELENIKRSRGLSEDKAFLFWFATTILEINDDSAFEAMSVEGANDKGIDLFYIDDDEGRVFIAQGKFSSSLNYAAREHDVANLESSLNWLASPEALDREGRPELVQAAKDYLNVVKEGYGVELLYVYAGKKSQNVDKKIAVYNQNEDNIAKRRTFRHYHIDLLHDLWEE